MSALVTLCLRGTGKIGICYTAHCTQRTVHHHCTPAPSRPLVRLKSELSSQSPVSGSYLVRCPPCLSLTSLTNTKVRGLKLATATVRQSRLWWNEIHLNSRESRVSRPTKGSVGFISIAVVWHSFWLVFGQLWLPSDGWGQTCGKYRFISSPAIPQSAPPGPDFRVTRHIAGRCWSWPLSVDKHQHRAGHRPRHGRPLQTSHHPAEQLNQQS